MLLKDQLGKRAVIKQAILALALCTIGFPATAEVVDTLDVKAGRMEWWQDAKFGMFIHWGAYSKAGGEWKGTTNHGEWLQFTAKIPLAEYRELAAGFNPVEFDANEWVSIAKKRGYEIHGDYGQAP